ncbi:IS66 family insertion sequence element accessory protein TnpB [Paracoccus thiocyanatus]|uniref:IS66 family insertion sequence element accessory protein TnpB n=1 Tax=Paracoccus thiocyanatus TaxID=34006 RepID=UPI0035ABFC8B
MPFAFRGRWRDRLKLLHWDQQGFCPRYQPLKRDASWPACDDGPARLTSAQLAALGGDRLAQTGLERATGPRWRIIR